MKIHQAANGWEYWWDTSTRSWWAAKFVNGSQIGEAIFAYTKWEIKALIDSENEVSPSH